MKMRLAENVVSREFQENYTRSKCRVFVYTFVLNECTFKVHTYFTLQLCFNIYAT